MGFFDAYKKSLLTYKKETSYKKFVSGYKDGQRLLDLALSVD